MANTTEKKITGHKDIIEARLFIPEQMVKLPKRKIAIQGDTA